MQPENLIIDPPQYDTITAFGIGGIAVGMAALCVVVYSRGNSRRRVKLTIGAALWMAVTAIAAEAGLLSRFDLTPPPMALMMASVFAIAIGIGFSPLGRTLANETSLMLLVALQIFRFPLELVMHHAADQSIMPVQLSYSGYNFDIITGLGAILLVSLMKFKTELSKVVVWIWNIWGMYCLLAIAIIAITTSPMAQAFGNDPANLNTWVLFFPYVWLPVVLVTIAISGHIIITRKLL